MAERALEPMSADDFLDWAQDQEPRYELVDGAPRLMAGGSGRHDRIIVNILVSLGSQLSGTRCRPFTADFAVKTGPKQVRRPDVGVDCGVLRDTDLHASDPRLVVEVLSPSTREFDMFDKIEEYKAVESLDAIVLVEPNAPQMRLWSRDAERLWIRLTLDGLEAVADWPTLGVQLKLAEVYAGLSFRPRPRLVTEADDETF